MKKQIIKRGLVGFPAGIVIGFVITLIISACVGDGSYYEPFELRNAYRLLRC